MTSWNEVAIGWRRRALAFAALGAMLGTACGGDDSPPAPPAWEGTPCGGFSGRSCGDNPAYCDFPDEHRCGQADGAGVCRARPDVCIADCPGVCGCDGKFYCNACEAHLAGVDDVSDGHCMNGSR